MVPYSSTEEEEKEEDSFLNVLYARVGGKMKTPRVQNKIFAGRARLIKGKCWREGTFVRVCICTALRTIYEC